MPCILPVSGLRNYNEVLQNVSEGFPVFLTKKWAELFCRYRYQGIRAFDCRTKIAEVSGRRRTICKGVGPVVRSRRTCQVRGLDGRNDAIKFLNYAKILRVSKIIKMYITMGV